MAAAADDVGSAVIEIGLPAPAGTNVDDVESAGVVAGETAEVVAIEEEHAGIFAGGNGEIARGAWLGREKHDATGTEVGVTTVEVVDIGGSEQARIGSWRRRGKSRGKIGIQAEDAFLDIGGAIVRGVIGIAGNEKEIAGRIGGEAIARHPDKKKEQVVFVRSPFILHLFHRNPQ